MSLVTPGEEALGQDTPRISLCLGPQGEGTPGGCQGCPQMSPSPVHGKAEGGAGPGEVPKCSCALYPGEGDTGRCGGLMGVPSVLVPKRKGMQGVSQVSLSPVPKKGQTSLSLVPQETGMLGGGSPNIPDPRGCGKGWGVCEGPQMSLIPREGDTVSDGGQSCPGMSSWRRGQGVRVGGSPKGEGDTGRAGDPSVRPWSRRC